MRNPWTAVHGFEGGHARSWVRSLALTVRMEEHWLASSQWHESGGTEEHQFRLADSPGTGGTRDPCVRAVIGLRMQEPMDCSPWVLGWESGWRWKEGTVAVTR